MPGSRVLVVEDARCSSDAAKHLLDSGFEVVSVESAQAAFQVLEQGLFDTVLVDAGLPDMSVRTFLRVLRKKDSRVGIVVMTWADPEHVERQLEDGLSVWSVLGKPFNNGNLADKVVGACEMARMPRARQEELAEEVHTQAMLLRNMRLSAQH